MPTISRKWSGRLAQWVSRNPVIAIGGFMSGMFLGVGVLGSLAFMPRTTAWFAAASWPTAMAEITSSNLAFSMGRRTVRPDFTFRYAWDGQVYTAKGYDLLAVYTNDFDGAQAIVRDHPVGSPTLVRVNPEAPGQAVMTRGEPILLLLYFLPALFALLGLIGATFTTAAWLGWLDPDSKHPFGRATRAVGAVLLRGDVLKALFFTISGSVILGILLFGAIKGNGLLVITAGVMAWGIWRASRGPR